MKLYQLSVRFDMASGIVVRIATVTLLISCFPNHQVQVGAQDQAQANANARKVRDPSKTTWT